MYEFSASSYLNKLLRLALRAAHLPLLLGILWVIGLFFCRPLCALTLIPILIIAMWRIQQNKLRHVRTWIAFFCLAEFGLFLALPGPSARLWQEGMARDHGISEQGNGVVHLNFIRDFIYHGAKKAEIRYLEEDFQMQDLTGVYLAECVNRLDKSDCKLMLSFAFRDGRFLVFSPEMRVPAGKEVNSLRRHYKEYGLFYLFGTEEDIFALHTDEHRDYLSLYPLKADPEHAQAMLAACLRLAVEAQEKHRAYHPLQQTYYNDLRKVLGVICPALTEPNPIRNAHIAKLLYRNGATQIPEKGDWTTVRRRYALGFDIHPEPREAYSDLIRKRIGLPVRDTVPTRTVQVISQDELQTQPHPEKESSASAGFPFLTSSANTADIPEPGMRLKNDKQEEGNASPAEPQETATDAAADTAPQETDDSADDAAENTRKLNEQESLLPAKPSVADGILEPGARLHADNRREEEEEEAMSEAQKKAEQGRDIMEDVHKKPADGSNFNELFFGKRKSGITIIEKKKPKEEPHPLDPMRKQKRKNPFDEEKPQPDTQQEADPFAPKAPIRIGG